MILNLTYFKGHDEKLSWLIVDQEFSNLNDFDPKIYFRMSDVIKIYENTLHKVRSKKWGHPLGKAMSITGHILKLAGKWGAPFTGILGSALTVGSKLLNPNPNVASCLSVTHIEDGFKEVSNNLPIIQIQVCFLRHK